MKSHGDDEGKRDENGVIRRNGAGARVDHRGGDEAGVSRRGGDEYGINHLDAPSAGPGWGKRDEPDREREKRDLEETLDRERHGSGDYDADERYGRHDVEPDREEPQPGDEEPDAEERNERGQGRSGG